MMSTSTDANPSFCASEKRVSQWEELMRKFSRAHKEICKSTQMSIPRAYRSTKYFPTGSHYKGTWDVLGMSGFGTYSFPNGVIYIGDFEDGMFHGKGQLRYSNGCILDGQFNRGVMTERVLTFPDGLKYEEHDWKYCKMPDRRYSMEYDKGLMPSGLSNLTAKMPPRVIPPGFYDTGDGFFNPVTKCVYNAKDPTAILRSPSDQEQKWIMENCRVAPDPNIGPAHRLYEQWSIAEEVLPPPPPPASATRSKPSKPQTYYGEPKDNYFWVPGPINVAKTRKRRNNEEKGPKSKRLRRKKQESDGKEQESNSKTKEGRKKQTYSGKNKLLKKTFYDPRQWPFVVANSRWIYNEFIRPLESLLYAEEHIYHKSCDMSYDEIRLTRAFKRHQLKPPTDLDYNRLPTFRHKHETTSCSSDSTLDGDILEEPEIRRDPSIKFKKVHYMLDKLFKEKLMRVDKSK